MEKTEWYPSSIDPLWIGWYQCKYIYVDQPVMLYWNGLHWALGEEDTASCAFNGIWRGLTRYHPNHTEEAKLNENKSSADSTNPDYL